MNTQNVPNGMRLTVKPYTSVVKAMVVVLVKEGPGVFRGRVSTV